MTTPDLAAAVDFEIAEMLAEHAGSDEPFDWFGMAAATEAVLARDPTAANFDPADPDLWRAVAVELRRRGMRAKSGGGAS